MAIDPRLVSIKKVTDIPTVPLSELQTGQMFGYTGDGDLKKVATNDLLGFIKSGIKGTATQANAPTVYTPEAYPNGLFETYVVRTPLTMPNSWGSAVTQLELDANNVFFDVKNGVVSKEVSLKPIVNLSSVLNPLGTTKAPSEKAVADYTANKIGFPDLGLVKGAEIGSNFGVGLLNTDFSDINLWGGGYLDVNGNIVVLDDRMFIYNKFYHPLPFGEYNTNFFVNESASIVIYNSDQTIQQIIQLKGDRKGTIFWTLNQTDLNGGYIRISYKKSLDDIALTKILSERTLVNLTKIVDYSDSVFMPKSTKTDFTEEVLSEKYGVEKIPKFTEFLTQYISSNVLDQNIWLKGYYKSDGTIGNELNWYHPTKLTFITKGTYTLKSFIYGNAKVLIFETDKSTVQTVLTNLASSDFNTQTFTILNDGYLALSHRESIDEASPMYNQTPLISLVNTEDLYPKILTSNDEVSGTTDLRKIYKDTFAPRQKRKIATFICDDGPSTDLSWFIPLIDEFKIKATFAISTHWIDTENRLTREQIIQMHKDGHDIASHTKNHLYMNTLTPEVLEEEIAYAKVYLEAMLSAPVDMFVSPFGTRNAGIDYVISKYHKANFISGYSNSNSLPLDSFFINRISFDLAKTNTAGYEIVKAKIDDAIAQGNQWTVFAVHTLYGEYKTTNTVDRRQELRDIITYLISQGYEIMTAKDAYNYYKNPVEIGVKRYHSAYYKLGMDGSEENVNYF